jgi:hypothetical protein
MKSTPRGNGSDPTSGLLAVLAISAAMIAPAAGQSGTTHTWTGRATSRPPQGRVPGPRSTGRGAHEPQRLFPPAATSPFFLFRRGVWPLFFYGGIGLDYLPGLPEAVPGSPAAPGGLQLDVEPRRAEVYVDGEYAGAVDDFSGYYRHLELPAGAHTIAVIADGYEPLIMTALVTPGKTTSYRGTLTYVGR